jgi:hypothetical protein
MTARACYHVELATPADEPALRRLLRDSPMEGAISLSLEREPELGLAAAVEGRRHVAVVARDPGGSPVALATRTVRTAFVDGEPAQIGYLGQLRVLPELRGNLRVLRLGTSLLRGCRRADELPFDFTSIVSDNLRARRLLEAGIDRLPAYQPIGEMVTLAFATARAPRRAALVRGSIERLPEIAAFLRADGARRQLAPCPTVADLASTERARGLAPRDFLLAEQDGRLVGCGAIWDQRGFKQAVVRGYAPHLRLLRPLLATVGPALGLPRLPPVGTALASAFLAFLAVADDDRAVFDALLDAALVEARARRLELLALGLAADHPLLGAAQRRPHRAYRSTLYAVDAGQGTAPGAALAGRPLGPEVATL